MAQLLEAILSLFRQHVLSSKASGAFENPRGDYAFDQKPAFEAKVQ
jgi:hypothetical protein